ncbi:UDP-4-amino-4,6-dideoxy-N-acetyl-beta-L-altrosamine N-acetyltransferase [Vibrio mediterranei]|nr:UDP-4-amino-4,6-dideoxy-N-acetyl-beta-L-altrosamine N-acetyltransferase [Vibrio mediterranei]
MSSKNVELIPLSFDDLENILEWRNDPNIRSNMYTSHEISWEEHLAWFERLKEDSTKQYFVVKIAGESVGVVGFSEINVVKGIATWAFYASPQAPRGTGSLMEYFALEHAFSELNLHKLRCEVLGFNKTVVKLHKKFGFKEEGVLRSAFHDGDTYYDIVHLGIFASEWNDIRENMKAKLRLN